MTNFNGCTRNGFYTTRMISALRWASDVIHFICFINCAGQSHETEPISHFFFKEKGEANRSVEPRSSRLPAERLNHQAMPAHHTKQQKLRLSFICPNEFVIKKARVNIEALIVGQIDPSLRQTSIDFNHAEFAGCSFSPPSECA